MTAAGTGKPTDDLARRIDQLLALPAAMPHTGVQIGTLIIEPWPPLRELRWRGDGGSQTLDWSIGARRFSVQSRPAADRVHELVADLQGGTGSGPTQHLELTVSRSPTAMHITGNTIADLSAWMPLFGDYGLLPSGDVLSIASAPLELTIAAELPDDPANPATVTASILPTATIALAYRDAAGDLTNVQIDAGDVFVVSASLPTLDWRLERGHTEMTVSVGEFRDLPMTLSALSCRSGPVCSFSSTVDAQSLATPLGRMDALKAASTQTVSVAGDEILADVEPGAQLQVLNLSLPVGELARLDANAAAALTITVGDNGWSLQCDSVDATVESLATGAGAELSAQVYTENLRVEAANRHVSGSVGIFVPSIGVAVAGMTASLPGLRGTSGLEDGKATANLATVGLSTEGTISARYDLQRASGRVALNGARMSFTEKPLGQRITPRQNAWDVSAGAVLLDLEADWSAGAKDSLTARASVRPESISGFYRNIVFTGLTTALAGSYATTKGASVQPASMSVGLVDAGFPIRNITADYRLDAAILAADVENLRMEAFGGVIRADPFSFRTGADSNTLTLRAESLNLARLLSIEEFEAMEVTGLISAELPLTIAGDTITIAGGHLTGEPPGGVIRYRAGGMPDKTDTSAMGIATLALSNFVYESLTSDVSYGADGNLILKMKLTGRNPDLDSTRPVVLNLSVENNVREMLRSLQAARNVEDILKRRLEQQ